MKNWEDYKIDYTTISKEEFVILARAAASKTVMCPPIVSHARPMPFSEPLCALLDFDFWDQVVVLSVFLILAIATFVQRGEE